MLIFGDLHLHSTHPVMGRDYLTAGINAMKQIRKYAAEHNEKNIIHLGDTFQLKDRIPVRVWNAFFDELLEWGKSGLISYWLKGNHDFDTDISIEAFNISKNAHPIIENSIIQIEGYNCEFVPFGNKPNTNIKVDILFMHDYFRGESKLSNDIISNEGINLSSLHYVPLIVSGHAHEYQYLNKNVFHLGSPYQTNFNEIGQDKFFMRIDKKGIDFIKFSHPKFIKLNPDNLVGGNFENCYVKVIYDRSKWENSSVNDIKKIRELLIKNGAVKVILEPQNTTVIKQRIKMKSIMKEIDYFSEYINLYKGELSKKKLYEVGINIMELSGGRI